MTLYDLLDSSKDKNVKFFTKYTTLSRIEIDIAIAIDEYE